MKKTLDKATRSPQKDFALEIRRTAGRKVKEGNPLWRPVLNAARRISQGGKADMPESLQRLGDSDPDATRLIEKFNSIFRRKKRRAYVAQTAPEVGAEVAQCRHGREELSYSKRPQKRLGSILPASLQAEADQVRGICREMFESLSTGKEDDILVPAELFRHLLDQYSSDKMALKKNRNLLSSCNGAALDIVNDVTGLMIQTERRYL